MTSTFCLLPCADYSSRTTTPHTIYTTAAAGLPPAQHSTDPMQQLLVIYNGHAALTLSIGLPSTPPPRPPPRVIQQKKKKAVVSQEGHSSSSRAAAETLSAEEKGRLLHEMGLPDLPLGSSLLTYALSRQQQEDESASGEWERSAFVCACV